MAVTYITELFHAKNADVVGLKFQELQKKFRMRRSLSEPNWAGFCGLVLLGRSFGSVAEGQAWIEWQRHIGGKVCFGFRCGEQWVLIGRDESNRMEKAS